MYLCYCDGSISFKQKKGTVPVTNFFHAQIDRADSYPTIHNEPPWIQTDDGQVAVTAYFRNPKEICVCKGKCKKHLAKKPPIGDRLWIQMADVRKKKNVMVIPLNTNQIAGTPWVEGTCVTAMGKVDLTCVSSSQKTLCSFHIATFRAVL